MSIAKLPFRPVAQKMRIVLNATGVSHNGSSPVLFIDQNIDPGAASGTINVDRLVEEAARQDRESPFEWGMIDYEAPYDAMIGDRHSTESNRSRASAQLIAALDALRTAFPATKWTVYGIPGLAQYPDGKLWVTASQDAREEEINRQIRSYGEVMAHCDWFSPCLYDTQRNATQRPQDVAINADNEDAYRRARITVCKRFNFFSGTRKPIVPCVCPVFCNGGNVAGGELRLVPSDEFMSDQIRSCSGADGACVWLAPNWIVRAACSPDGSCPEQDAARRFIAEDLSPEPVWPQRWEDADVWARTRVEFMVRNSLSKAGAV